MQNPLTVEGLRDWLKDQPAGKSYCYSSGESCLLYQYLKYTGFPVKRVGGFAWHDKNEKIHRLGESMVDIAALEPHTFGAALERANAT